MPRSPRKPVEDPVVARIRATGVLSWKQGGGTAKGFLKLCVRLVAESKPPKEAAA